MANSAAKQQSGPSLAEDCEQTVAERERDGAAVVMLSSLRIDAMSHEEICYTGEEDAVLSNLGKMTQPCIDLALAERS
ncbi:hypothetical protein SRHO_G00210790 [Serrasalmus rhombeus]